VVGIDVQRYDEWSKETSARLVSRALGQDSVEDLGQFDLIFSFSVWEHVHEPYEALKAVKALLASGGDLYLSANLYRGSQASHRYAEVFFPWPHLLFDDSVFEAFYERRGIPGKRAAWVNRLSAAEYLTHFRELGLSVMRRDYTTTPFDEAFYRRFEDRLGRYPRVDLERDFIKVHLRHTPRWRQAAQSLLALEMGQLSSRVGYGARLLSDRVRRARQS
jgi:SAM-dependent methyltransferase